MRLFCGIRFVFPKSHAKYFNFLTAKYAEYANCCVLFSAFACLAYFAVSFSGSGYQIKTTAFECRRRVRRCISLLPLELAVESITLTGAGFDVDCVVGGVNFARQAT